MLSDKLNVSILTALLKQHGIKDIVICPGSRDIPLIHNLVSDDFFNCRLVTDERSAGFFALGIALAAQSPCAVCCTSGSALLNLHSALSEAYYQRIPLIVISADRSAAFISQMDGQTIKQDGIFSALVKKEVNLPQVLSQDDNEGLWYCSRLVNETLSLVKLKPWGPVHINVPISDPFFSFNLKQINPRFFTTATLKQALEFINRKSKRLLIIGQNQQQILLDHKLRQALEDKFIVFAEHIANVDGLSYGSVLDLLLLNQKARAALAPEVIVSLGGQIISKRLKQYLRQHKCAHILIDNEYNFADTYLNLKYAVKSDLSLTQLLERLAADNSHTDTAYLVNFKRKAQDLPAYDFAYSQMGIIGKVMHSLQADQILHLSNSSNVRYAEFFNKAAPALIMSNRGVNGIDGSISTAIGFAAVSSGINYILTGDLSFFYDVNALWNENLGSNIKIILINNQGGEIFFALKNLQLDDKVKHFVVSDHQIKAEHIAKAFSLRYLNAHDEESFKQGFAALQTSNKACILECFTQKDRDIAILKAFFKSIENQ